MTRRNAELAALLFVSLGTGCWDDSVAAYTISGTVSGAVVAGVAVNLTGAVTATATTDTTGAYSFSGLANGEYTVAPFHGEYRFTPASAKVTVNGSSVTGRDFTSAPAPDPIHSISGTVSGDAVAGVTVKLSGASSATTTTDGAGGYSFGNLASGAYTVTPSLAGYWFDPASLAVTVAGADVAGQNFIAREITYGISGVVSGAVAAGVTVSLSGATIGAWTTTDGTGAYSFHGLASGEYTVTPSLAGYTFDPVSLAVTVAGADVAGQSFIAYRARYSISGVVSGAVAAGVTVSLSGASSATTTTDGTGAYSFTGLANGAYTVTPSLAGYWFNPASLAVTVASADVAGRNFIANEIRYSIYGIVSGDAAAGVTVSLSGASSATTTTSANGAYQFGNLANGAYTVTPSLGGYWFEPASLAVTVAGASVAVSNFIAHQIRSSISGIVSGDAAAGVTVSLSGASSATTTTDVAGAYSFADLAPGAYTVTPSVPACTFEPASVPVTLAGADVAGQNFTARAFEPPPAPTGVSVFPGNGSATISWTGTGASFKVYYALAPEVTASDSSATSAASPAVVGSIANGTPYYFAVAGVNSKGEGPLSSVACAVPTPADTTGLTLHDPLCGAVLDARRWQPPGPYSFRVENGVALLEVDADDQEPRHLRDANVESSVSVNTGGRRVTTLTADVMVPAASVVRTGGAHVRAGVRMLYQPPAFRLDFPGGLRDALAFEVGLIEAGGGLQAFRGITHCDDPSCGPVSTTGITFADPVEFAPIGAGMFHVAAAAYDTTYSVTASFDEATGLFHWTVAGGSFGAGISGSADPSPYLASAPGWSGVPLAGAGFRAASILARSQDESVDGGGRGKITARVQNVLVGLDGEAATPFDDFSGTGFNSRAPEFALAKWNASGAVELAPSGGSLRMHQQATSAGTATSFGHGIRIANPAGDIIQADVTIESFGSTGPGSASEDVIVQGRFYNDGSGSTPSSAVGDVLAGVALQPATNTAMWWIGRCTTDSCSGALEPYQSGFIDGVTVGTGLHTVKVEWDPYNSVFIFTVDGVEGGWIDPGGAYYAGPANAPSREVLTRVRLPADAGQEASSPPASTTCSPASAMGAARRVATERPRSSWPPPHSPGEGAGPLADVLPVLQIGELGGSRSLPSARRRPVHPRRPGTTPATRALARTLSTYDAAPPSTISKSCRGP